MGAWTFSCVLLLSYLSFSLASVPTPRDQAIKRRRAEEKQLHVVVIKLGVVPRDVLLEFLQGLQE